MYQNTENGMMFFGNFDENKIRQYHYTHQQYRPTYNAVVVLDFCKTFLQSELRQPQNGEKTLVYFSYV
ncbi:hypothetical protein [Flavobacterium sp.]|jgi:hypothetical protein|uniref:hypothetical protein n=1 Tax=Flavobacterium sp. TaxID=239 RepID=UPI0037BF00B3